MKERHVPADAQFIGRGKQGAVYQISPDRCMKLYYKTKHAQMEYEAYVCAAQSSMIPKLYEHGARYLVMEYIHGESLQNKLAAAKMITREECAGILELIYEMKRLGFKRIDTALFHMYMSSPAVKIIDLVHAYQQERSIPTVMLKGLAKLQLLDIFLNHVQDLDHLLYKEWTAHIASRRDRYVDPFK